MKIEIACSKCGADLVVRTNSETNEEFLGCGRFPECKFTRPMPVDVLLRRQGQPTLF